MLYVVIDELQHLLYQYLHMLISLLLKRTSFSTMKITKVKKVLIIKLIVVSMTIVSMILLGLCIK